MNVVVVGAGRIGSTFAFHLARAGHDVTVVARGARLAALRGEGAIVAVDGTRAPVHAVAELDVSVPYDLALVTVLRHQVDVLIPTLAASAAKSILFLFNTFDSLDPWRAALGTERFASGFPNMMAFLIDGRLRSVVDGPGMVTAVSDARLAEVLSKAGLATVVESDMNGYLRSHVALVVPMMVASVWTWKRASALTWAEASKLSAAMVEGFGLVRGLGHALRPGFAAVLSRMPSFILTTLIWSLARTASVKDLGAFGPDEPRALIDAMAAAVPGGTPKLLALRP